MITEQEFLNAIEIVNNYKKQVKEQFEKAFAVLEKEKFSHLTLNKNTSIYDSGLSVRNMNILKACDISVLGDLMDFSKSELLQFRGLGKAGFLELEECLLHAGIVLKRL